MITKKERREIDREVRKARRARKKAEVADRRATRKAEASERMADRKANVSSGKAKRKPLFSENKVRQSLRENKEKAKAFLNDDEKMDSLLSGFEAKLKLVPRVGNRLADIPAMLAMLRAYIRREYRKVPLDTILLAVAAVLYVVNPLDVVPDVLVGLGYLDDATALGIVLNAIHSDIVDFKKWQAAKREVALAETQPEQIEEVGKLPESEDE